MDIEKQIQIRSTTRVLQLITAALVAGLLTFAGFVLFFNDDKQQYDEGSLPVITIIASCIAMMAIVAAKLVPSLVQRHTRRNIIEGNRINNNVSGEQATAMGDLKLVAGSYLTTKIVGLAILEGASFMNLMAYWLEQEAISLILVTGLLLTMLFKFPSTWQVGTWIKDELKMIVASRALRD